MTDDIKSRLTGTDNSAHSATEQNPVDARLRPVFDQAQIGLAILREQDGQCLDCNSAFSTLTGYTKAYFGQANSLALVLSGSGITLADAYDGIRSERGRYGPIEGNLNGWDGQAVPVLLSLARITGEQNEALLLLTLHDMTACRPVAVQLSELTGGLPLYHLQLMAKVFEQSCEAIIIADRHNRIVCVNSAFSKETGYSREEVMGKDPRFLSSGQTTESEYRSMCRTLLESGTWEGEVWGRRKEGAVYPKWMTVSLVFDDAGRPEHYIAGFTNITERGDAVERIAHLAHHDSLTQLLNRAAMEGQLRRALASARREGHQVAVMLIDMDRFKTINDSLGHHIGDGLLVSVAKRLIDNVRASDIVARLGGDEFVVILANIENTHSVAGLASKLKRSLGDHYEVDGHSLYSTPSIGVSLFPFDGDDPDTLLRHADTAMYHAKSQGRDNYQFYSEGMNTAAAERLKLENGLRQALESTHLPSSEFSLHFQPQFHVQSQRIIGLEALARWTHPEWGPIPPEKFIAIAEETGLIQPLGDWVFWEACRQLRNFMNEGISGIRMAVNLSAQQLRHEALPSVVYGALTCYDLQPSDLELDITESTAMQNPAATIAILGKLSDMGIVLAIDDFGTGYSSLSQLKHLPIHRLKLDRCFVKDIETDRDDAAICSAAIMLGHNLGLDLVAEGIETEGQRDFLQKLGCDVLQGFFYSKPMPPEEVVPFLKAWSPK
jgi:diguanylate cyclase (GGDEF)-like protein/PAS domain S-box-containing protein